MAFAAIELQVAHLDATPARCAPFVRKLVSTMCCTACYVRRMNHPLACHGLFAPGSPSLSQFARAPSHGESQPAVDDRLVAPESAAQIIDGRLRLMPGAHEGHALKHTEVALSL
jgi:hypothetical protein